MLETLDSVGPMNNQHKTQLLDTLRKLRKIPRPAGILDVSEEAFQSMMPKQIRQNPRFTPHMDLEFQDRWLKDPATQKKSYPCVGMPWGNPPEKKNKDSEALLTLWQVCCGAIGCWPTQIISRENHLAYQPMSGIGEDSMVWGKAFFQSLTCILLSDACGQHVPTIQAYLQYAVICRRESLAPRTFHRQRLS